MKDFYKILEVDRNAPDAEIKKSYRRLAKKYHPDVNKGDKSSEEKFKDIQEAYDVLGDKKKRQEYDMFGAAGVGAGAGYQPGAGQYYYSTGPQGGFDFSEFFTGGKGTPRGGRGDFENLGDIFGDIFGMGGAGRRGGGFKGRPEGPGLKGADHFYTMDLDFMDAVRGKTTKIAIPKGNRTEKIQVKIPAGVDTGSKIRLAGKGEPSPTQGPPGDLFIEVKVHPHLFFKREGDDIYLNVPITLEEAIEGAGIEVPTISGKINMKIPPGTQGGQRFRLKGKGVPHRKSSGSGDQYVVVQIQIPKNVDAEGKKIIGEFSKKYPQHPRKGLFE